MNLARALLALAVFPGLLYAVPMAWLLLWVERKFEARLQGRIGPPFYQPMYDFLKLMAKRSIYRPRLEAFLLTGLPLLAVGSGIGALSLLPVFSGGVGFAGDVVLLVTLLEMPAICAVLTGFASRSIFGQVGATREAVLSIVCGVPFLAAFVALAAAAGSLDLTQIALVSSVPVRVLAVLAIVLSLPMRLRLNPFSISNAEQEIYAGPTTEFDGPRLALWELAHGLEWVVLVGLVATLTLPYRFDQWLVDAILFVALSLIVALILSTISAATARLKLPSATRFYWQWGMGLAVAALVVAALPAWGG